MLVIKSVDNNDYFVGFQVANKLGNRTDYEVIFSKRKEDAQPFENVQQANYALAFIHNADYNDNAKYNYEEVK